MNVVKALQARNFGRILMYLMLEDIDHVSSTFQYLSLNHVRQARSTMSHLAARLAPFNGGQEEHVLIINPFPKGIVALVELDHPA